MSDKTSTRLVLFAIGIVVVSVVVGLVAYSSQSTGEEPEVQELVSMDNHSLNEDELVRVTGYDDDEVTIVGSSPGEFTKESVRLVENGGDQVYVQIESGNQNDGVAKQDGGKAYKMKISGVDQEDEIVVDYGGGETVTLRSGNQSDETTENEGLDYKMELISSTAASPSNQHSVNVREDTVLINGSIVGNTGGQNPVVQYSSLEDGTLKVEVGLQKPDGFATQVISEYQYELQFRNLSETVENVKVLHNSSYDENDLRVPEKGDPPQEEDSEDIKYDFESVDSVDTTKVVEVVDENEDTFVLEGTFLTGSSTCTEAGLDFVELNGESIRVGLSPTSTEGPSIRTPREGEMTLCTDDISPSSYRLKVNHGGVASNLSVNVEQEFEEDVRRYFDLR